MTPELKCCPFCGGNAIISYDPDGVQDAAGRKWAWTVVCDRCCATSGLTFLKEKAAAAWNRRVPVITDDDYEPITRFFRD